MFLLLACKNNYVVLERTIIKLCFLLIHSQHLESNRGSVVSYIDLCSVLTTSGHILTYCFLNGLQSQQNASKPTDAAKIQ